ncbi:MAG TPA: hypothetical protein VF884_15110, partial [Nitrososphaeraceae archaeon]
MTVSAILVLGFITSSHLNSSFVVDAKKSHKQQTEDKAPDFAAIDVNSSANSNMSNMSLPAESSSGGPALDNSTFAENPENVTPSAENATTSGQPATTTTEENVTPSAENATTSGQPATTTNNGTSGQNITTTSAPPVGGVDILNSNTNASADQALPAEQEQAASNATTTNATSPVATETTSDTLNQTTAPEDTLGAKVSNETDTAASAVAGVSASNSKVENNQVSNVQNVINNIAVSAAQSGGNSQNIAQQISKEIIANPKGPVANSIKQLANEFSQGNPDEVNIAANQIGSLIAKGNNIQQTLVQVTNKVVNNIKNIKATENNFDKVIINPSSTSQQKSEITQTVNVIKKGKQEVDVPRIHIK